MKQLSDPLHMRIALNPVELKNNSASLSSFEDKKDYLSVFANTASVYIS